MKKVLSAIILFLSGFYKTYISNRKDHSNSTPPNPHPEQHQMSQIKCHQVENLQGNIDAFCHPAILFPDFVGQDLENVTLEQFQGGYDTYFFYREDYSSYTEIKDGRYIIKGYDDGVNVGNWLVSLQIIGEYEDLKAIVCFNFGEVPIIREEESKGPDDLDMTICYFMFSTKPKRN